jgi:rhodanese-related sulfurtransferase
MKTRFLVAVTLALVAGLAFAGARPEQRSVQSEGDTATLSSEALQGIIAKNDGNTFLVDVRTAEEYRSGAIPSAINIPYDVIQDNLPTEDRSARIIVYCRSGNRSGVAAKTLAALGFQNVLDFGGIGRWTGELVKPE